MLTTGEQRPVTFGSGCPGRFSTAAVPLGVDEHMLAGPLVGLRLRDGEV
ncbi:hypothetical protein [Nocardia araoensis]|nr:hypothetical protein [Nocardia araoensis]